MRKNKAGRKRLPPGLKKVQLYLYLEENRVKRLGGRDKAQDLALSVLYEKSDEK